MSSPTALNKRGNKVYYGDYVFDSSKEFRFFKSFVENCGLPYEVHPSFELIPKTPLGGTNIRSAVYTPDFIIKDPQEKWLHVIDVKNSFGAYGIDQGNKLKFKLFALRYKHPVETVVVRKFDFKVITQSTTRPLNIKQPFITDNFNYTWQDATRRKK